ncbi:NifB/NifX family molybdenum-iron cluster-binding protein [candidate division KSB1 bacterium]|nr:NifB/NifX family molybdenum-iron cluster-binding protein [candidate division KSB1 bacterium]
MIIAITVQDNKTDTPVNPRFGRTAFYALYDEEKKSFSFLENEIALNSTSGAGVQAAQNIVNAGVKVLLTGHCGPKAFRALDAAGIEVYTGVSGTLQEAVDAYFEKKLKKTSSADVEGHWA